VVPRTDVRDNYPGTLGLVDLAAVAQAVSIPIRGRQGRTHAVTAQ
jgi:hypothetical protein